MSSNQWLVLMLFARSSTSIRARPPPMEAATTFFEECWYPDKLHQNRDIEGENALGTTCCWIGKLCCPCRSSGWTEEEDIKDWKGAWGIQEMTKEYNNLRELCTRFSSSSNSQSSTPVAWCNEHLYFDVWTHVLVWCVDSYAGLMWWYSVSGLLLTCEM